MLLTLRLLSEPRIGLASPALGRERPPLGSGPFWPGRVSRVTGAVCPLIVKSVALVTSATPLPHVTHCAHRPRPCGHLWGGASFWLLQA